MVQAKPSGATTVDETPKPSHNLSEISKTAIDELDGDKSKKVLLSTVLAAAKLHELPAFTALLKAAPDSTDGDHHELHDDYGSQATVAIPSLAAVATFKSTAVRFMSGERLEHPVVRPCPGGIVHHVVRSASS